MKLHQINEDKLLLSIKRTLAHLFGVLIILGTIVPAVYLMMQYQIVCKQKQPNRAEQCTLESSVYGFYHSSTPLGELKKAEVVSSQGNKGSTIYGIYLQTDSGPVSLTGGSSSSRTDKDSVVAAINTYISNSLATSFDVPYPTAWWLFAFAAVFPIIGFTLLCLRNVYILVDKVSKNVTIRRTGILKTDEESLSFSEIENVIIEESVTSRGSTVYRLAFALKNKAPMPLINTYDTNHDKKETIAKALNQFIFAKEKKPSSRKKQ
ncbi:MAG: hypothetical protein Q8M03_15645 [Legionella sp.]|nr:hypothetical protein [Legionella sp.]